MGALSAPRAHNASLSVARLPDDITLNIFKTYRAECYRIAMETMVFSSRYDWLRVGRVCHHWRLLLANTPSMWNDICFPCSRRRLEDMLRRSGETLLTIRTTWYGHTWNNYEITHVLAPRLHRLRFLEAEVQQTSSTTEFLHTWAQAAPPNPYLVSLRIWLTVPKKGCHHEASAVLTSARTPNLQTFTLVLNRRLSFQGCSFTANLKNLELFQVKGARTPAKEFYTLLASAPNLRELSLANILPDTSSPLPAITLLTLVKIDLQDTPVRTAHFLDSIHTHALREILIDCARTPPRATLELLAFAQALSARLRDADDAPPFTALTYAESGLDSERPVRVRVELAATAGGARVRYFEVTFRYREVSAPWVPSLLGALPLGDVTQAELVIWGSGGRLPSAVSRPDGDYAAWHTAFGGMRALEDLVVDSHIWKLPEEHFLGRDGLRRFFPRLRSLKVGNELVWPVSQAASE